MRFPPPKRLKERDETSSLPLCMTGTTIKEFASKLAASTNETFKKNNPQLFSRREQSNPDVILEPKSAFKIPEEKLNKLETRWFAVLRTRYPNPGVQNITLRLSDDLRYTPDLNSNQLPLVFFETKGLHRFREKGILKLRWAAREYPFFDFVLVEWDNSLSRWIETPISKK